MLISLHEFSASSIITFNGIVIQHKCNVIAYYIAQNFDSKILWQIDCYQKHYGGKYTGSLAALHSSQTLVINQAYFLIEYFAKLYIHSNEVVHLYYIIVTAKTNFVHGCFSNALTLLAM